MIAELKSLFSSDVDLGAYWPSEPNIFNIWIRAMIGPQGEEASESFDFEVVSADSFHFNESNCAMWGRHKIILQHYDLSLVEKKIAELCRRTTGDSWLEIATKLARYGKWEFEDYQPYKAQ